ncbi:MAG: FTR1 family protein [Pseudomonadota bacterium]
MNVMLVCLRTGLAVAMAGMIATAAAAADAEQAATLWRLLDYVAVDYREAVDEHGQIVNAGEYEEMREFSRTVQQQLQAMDERRQSGDLQAGADALVAAIDARARPDVVASAARALAAKLLDRYPMTLAPRTPPDLDRGAALYQAQCAGCHGAGGAGDGPLASGMEPPPIAFSEIERARERSVFALYQVITQGLDGTAMASYAHLPAEDRWALAFYSGSLAFSDAQVQAGAALWRRGVGEPIGDLEDLSATSPAALAQQLGEEDAQALLAYLRRAPAAVAGSGSELLATARARLAESRDAYARGERAEAARLALSAYLDGFEPVEPLLAARDRALMTRVEAAMTELRARIARAAPQADVVAQARAVEELFDAAEAALSDRSGQAASAFAGALTILLREGVEALLIVVAMIAFLRKAGRTEVMPYVHAGWVGALLAGVATWALATYLVSISGAGRELTEGFAALFAAVVLLFVGIWMHGKSQAGAWQRYVGQKLSHALSKRSAWFLALLAFVVVYREVFETILFYAALWSQGEHAAILGGGALAAVLLVAIAWAMLRYSMRLPIAQFFAFSALLVAVLAVVLAGKGVAALQEAGMIAVDTLAAPRIDLLGVYPTWQSLSAQVTVLLLLVAGFVWNHRRSGAAALASSRS